MSQKKAIKKIELVEKTPVDNPKSKAIIGVSSSELPSEYDQDKLNDNIKETEELAEKLKETQQRNKITADNYTLKFGKWKGMLAKSLLNIETINKYGKKEPVGRKYLCFLLDQSWLNESDKNIISQILCM